MEIKIISTHWFTPHLDSGIGIIVRDNGIDRRAYMGHCLGVGPQEDAKEILKKGAKVTIPMLEEILNNLKK